MPSIIFWNLNRKPLGGILAKLCHQRSVDVVVLAECALTDVALQLHLNTGAGATYLAPLNLSPKLKFLTKLPHGSLIPIINDGGISIWRLSPPLGPEILLVAAHLRSKLHMTEADQMFSITRLRTLIAEAEESVNHNRTVVIGDLNMNPFENAMVSAEGLHGILDRKIAARGARTVEGNIRRFFYNPMWGRMGDNSCGPPGTYFKDMSNYVNHYWNTYDQVLIRPELLDFFDDQDLSVITEVDGQSLLKSDRIDRSFSDHLPIYLNLKTEV